MSALSALSLQPEKQKLYDLVNWSSIWRMEDEANVTKYYKDFRTLADCLYHLCGISKTQRNKLFWQGLHCKDRAVLSPYLTDQCHIDPGADFDFWDLFCLTHDFFAQRRVLKKPKPKLHDNRTGSLSSSLEEYPSPRPHPNPCKIPHHRAHLPTSSPAHPCHLSIHHPSKCTRYRSLCLCQHLHPQFVKSHHCLFKATQT
jgi:hypothetical protein